VLTLTGRVAPPETSKQANVLREYRSGMFFRQFTLSETIDQPKIDAQLTDGVLRLELPKVEKARPRQITVRSS
jgi:HSP20 family protein